MEGDVVGGTIAEVVHPESVAAFRAEAREDGGERQACEPLLRPIGRRGIGMLVMFGQQRRFAFCWSEGSTSTRSSRPRSASGARRESRPAAPGMRQRCRARALPPHPAECRNAASKCSAEERRIRRREPRTLRWWMRQTAETRKASGRLRKEGSTIPEGHARRPACPARPELRAIAASRHERWLTNRCAVPRQVDAEVKGGPKAAPWLRVPGSRCRDPS